MRVPLLLILAFFLFSAQNCKKGDNQFTEEDTIEMRKTACFGSCPIYSITINGKGMASYDGDRFVDKEGEYEKQFSAEETNKLFTAFAEADFWQYEEEYTAEVTDLPTTYLTFKHDGKEKKIKMYADYPDELQGLAELVAQAAESEGWTKK